MERQLTEILLSRSRRIRQRMDNEPVELPSFARFCCPLYERPVVPPAVRAEMDTIGRQLARLYTGPPGTHGTRAQRKALFDRLGHLGRVHC